MSEEHMNLARLKHGGEKFEVVIHPDKAMDYKHGKNVDLKEVLYYEKVFSDAHKGLQASENLMKNVFNTDDKSEIIKMIIMKGEIQLSAAYREDQRQKKWKYIIEVIHRNGVDPKTGLPHPAVRIENAMVEAKVSLDDHKRAEDQVQDVLKKIRTVLPIRTETHELEIKVPAHFAGKAQIIIRGFGTLLHEAWQNDGSFSCSMDVPAGLKQDLMDQLNKLTHGNIEIRVTKTK